MAEFKLQDIIADMDDVGQRMWLIGASEGAAGNISVFVRELDGFIDGMADQGVIQLPVEVPALANGWVVVSSAGRRVRDIARTSAIVLSLLQIDEQGTHATLYTAPGGRPTSELNSHLAIHNDHVGRRSLHYHAVVHAQPLRLTFLSHIERYADTRSLNARLLRWQPETIVEFPEGIGVLPFQMPGSLEQTVVTVEGMRTHRAVVWRRHGIVTRADSSVGKAGDLVEYAEAAAQYEYLNLQAGEPTAGLSDDDLRLICTRLKIEQTFF